MLLCFMTDELSLDLHYYEIFDFENIHVVSEPKGKDKQIEDVLKIDCVPCNIPITINDILDTKPSY